ncbi:T9SS type B sorting domain-containing protein [Winogradskyella endarachnes]|uniref:T9SS type B sorting domain-containing protein n=1 Tax=Winogradskyella endarachnes TaxID=2681965 RepID=A0A6L6U8A6_9FLAO|nr:T9SS type B sorting domain-containing protein [Winogradskyella endarachnes]MUU77776.1 T9SS type B sorting domain-containing protein [Winogradskyella endarachnes]
MKYLSLVLFFCLSYVGVSQNEANIWYFGENAGLDFNSGIPIALTDGQLSTLEGCSTISDQNGDLLFYSDGVTVWNKNHIVMLNGTGLNGNSSSTHSALIIPNPNDSDLYYIFTVDRVLNFGTSASGNGLQYSEVDMTLDGGLGAITNKNVLLHSPTTEKITGVKNANGDGFWVLSHKVNSNEFIAYEVTATGVNTTPVTSSVGNVVTVIGSNQEQNNAIGQIKFSPDGTKVAVARRGGMNEVVLLDFDTSTGVLSNQITLIDGLGSSPAQVYGLDFSSNSNVLYSSAVSGEVYQFNLDAGNANDIINSKILIQNNSTEAYGGIQLGPDCKIYIAKLNSGSLDVIDNPNEVGTGCNYIVDGVSLGGNLSKLGLPPFNQSLFNVDFNLEDENRNILADNLVLCEDQYTLYTTELVNSTVYTWYKDGELISGADSSTYIATEPGTYEVFAFVSAACGIEYEDEIVLEFGQLEVVDVEDEYCLDGSITSVTLSDYDLEIYTGSVSATISYHLSQSDAELNLNAQNTMAAESGQSVLYVRVENTSYPDCVSYSTLTVNFYDLPVFNNVDDLYLCDDDYDGVAAFDTSNIETSLLNGQTDITIDYYDESGNLLSSPLPDPFETQTQSITVRLTNSFVDDCYVESNINFIVNERPIAYTFDGDFVCDDVSNDGEHIFNLDDYTSQVLNGQSSINFEVQYFETEIDAEDNINSLENLYTVSSTSQTIYVRIHNFDDIDCYDITSFDIGVYYLPLANQPEDIIVCDDESNDGFEIFDLAGQNEAILGGQSADENVISYYLSEQDAETGENPQSTNFMNITNPQTIYARIENVNSSTCFSITSFELLVQDVPVLLMNENWPICEDGFVEIIADEGYDYYTWSSGETTRTITVEEPGEYTVTVSNVYGDLICSEDKTVTVSISDIAVITNIDTEDWSQSNNTISVFVEGNGDYEYSIDGVNFQADNVFTDLYVGDYTVYVRDLNGCGVVDEDVYLIYYPPFFTPNGDGKNETWQLINAQLEPGNVVYIFNRYGKLITEIKPNDFGWDGTYNGKNMPSSDYWFVLERQNGKVYRGHFALKR